MGFKLLFMPIRLAYKNSKTFEMLTIPFSSIYCQLPYMYNFQNSHIQRTLKEDYKAPE